MPYIPKVDRKKFDLSIDNLACLCNNPGDLTYCIYALCQRYMFSLGHNSYSRLSHILGIMECAKTEFYRRHIAPYEDEKILTNGDVE